MKKESTRCKKHTNRNNTRGITNELSKNYDIKTYDPVAKFKKQFSFAGNRVLPNFSGEYVAFEDISNGKYHIKLAHVRSGAIFEVPLGLALNAPVTKNPIVPMDLKNKR